MKKVAWIGTGVMGRPMALHLALDYDVHVYNRTYEKTIGIDLVTPHKDIPTLVKDADYIFSIVGFPADVKEVHEIIHEHAKKGAILIDMTTSSPRLAVSLYEQAKQKGLRSLDAPVTGGDQGAIHGRLSIMVGGDKDAFEEVLPLLERMGKRITYMGKAGNGQHAKLANQAAIAGAIGGLAESLSYAQNKGLSLESMLAVLTAGSAQSWQAENNGVKMIQDNMNPGFFIKHYLKDLRLILDEKDNLPLEIVNHVKNVYEMLLNDGLGEQGTQAIIKYYQTFI